MPLSAIEIGLHDHWSAEVQVPEVCNSKVTCASSLLKQRISFSLCPLGVSANFHLINGMCDDEALIYNCHCIGPVL
jgi:hypothetical protein